MRNREWAKILRDGGLGGAVGFRGVRHVVYEENGGRSNHFESLSVLLHTVKAFVRGDGKKMRTAEMDK
jgi:hypothetical protein